METTRTSSDNNASPYSEYELKQALNSLLDDSKNPSFDARHIFGYGDDNHKLSMLQSITATRILDYQAELQKSSSVSEAEMLETAKDYTKQNGPVLNLQTVIQEQSPRMALAAEFKRASPSKGAIAPHLKAGDQAVAYMKAGANILSVLTEPRWFQGSLQDMMEARTATTRLVVDDNNNNNTLLLQHRRPAVLRKDFVVNTYMIAEAVAAGADTVLLIVAVLPQHLLKRLIDYARNEFGMEPLVEVHADVELQVALEAGARVIGVNNRNLHTFQMDLSTSERVAQQFKEQGLVFDHRNIIHDDNSSTRPDYTLCALSGMSTAMDVDRYRQAGLGMCLIGESLMRASNPAAAIANLCLHPDDFEQRQQEQQGIGGAYTQGTQIVKVCGITNAEDALVACQAGASMIGVIFAPKSKRKVTAEQAKHVVDAVRKFGERSSQPVVAWQVLPNQSTTGALSHLVASSQVLVKNTQRPVVVGVFQNQTPEFVREMVQTCGLDLVQLHGSEGMAAANINQCGGVPAIRVVDICVDPTTGKASETAVETILKSVTNDPIAILLDTSIKGEKEGGGSGVSFDWSIAQRIQDAGLPVIIAGGLTPESVKDCVGSIRPFGVDVSSGVELSPGQKDHGKVRDFVQAARKAAQEASKGF